MDISRSDTALVITDPQNDFLSPEGATWGLVGKNVEENGTIEHIEQLITAAKVNGINVFISPHWYYPTDGGWQFGGTIENMMHDINMFSREGALTMDGFEGSGADWLERYKPLLNDGKTIFASPRTRCTVPPATTSRCNCASAASTRSSLPVCPRTSARRPICASCWRMVSRSTS
jgi:hypothetical protein